MANAQPSTMGVPMTTRVMSFAPTMEAAVISTYFKSGDDLTPVTNGKVLAELTSMVKDLAIPWLVIEDFNAWPLLRATDESTILTGNELDYALVARDLAPFATLSVALEVPFLDRMRRHLPPNYSAEHAGNNIRS